MALDSMKQIFERMERGNLAFWEVVLADDMEERQVSREASMAKMLSTWQAMQDAGGRLHRAQALRERSGRRRPG